MIRKEDEEKTKNEMGYDISSLSIGSHKIIYLQCDYCQRQYSAQFKNRNNGYKKFPKDSCVDCRFKKREEISLANYGVKNSAQRPEIRAKIKETNKDWINSEEFTKMSKETNLSKLGVEHQMQSPEFIVKFKQNILDIYGVDNIMKLESVAKEASKKSIKTRIDRGYIKEFDGKTMPEHAKEVGFSRSHFGKLVSKYGIELALTHERSISSLERAVTDWLVSKRIEYETQVRIGGKISDIKVGDTIIECDGLHWHCDIFVENNYHKEKMNIYKDNGFRSLFFRSDEINKKFNIVTSIISNALKINKDKFFARKLILKTVDHKTSKDFIEQNHLMGPSSSVTCSYGLYECDKLVSLLQMKKSKNNSYEISRYCNILNTSIVGGFSRLLKGFEKDHNPDSIFTFIDLRYGMGDYLESMGFKKIGSHLSFKWTNGCKTFHRMKFPSNSGYENGLHKIWDCGQLKFEKIFRV